MGPAYNTFVINACKILVGKPERKSPLGRPRRRWKYNIRMYLREIWREVVAGFIWLRLRTIGGLL
jgi:hypothetical protein